MLTGSVFGFILVTLGGLSNGSFLAPMTKMKKWEWENTWIIYSAIAFFIFPCLFILISISNIWQIYASAGFGTVLLVFIFGLGWGIGSVAFGLGVYYVGMALGYAIILGLISSIGSLVPLAVLHPERLLSTESAILYIGILEMFLGLAICAKAGMMRGTSGTGSKKEQSASRSKFQWGLVICIISGLMSSCMNFAIAFGKEITNQAINFGASNVTATYPLLGVTLAGGFFLNVLYSIYLLRKNKTWNKFRAGGSWYWVGALIMGFLWYTGLALYGFGILLLGDLGASIGWPITMMVGIIAGNFWGFFTGEWKNCDKKVITLQIAGIIVLSLAIAIIGYGNI